MASSQSRLALKKEQLAILSKFWMQFTESANAFINLNVAKGYKETSFQLSVLLKTVVDELEERKCPSFHLFLQGKADDLSSQRRTAC
jgi:hypothetical protein